MTTYLLTYEVLVGDYEEPELITRAFCSLRCAYEDNGSDFDDGGEAIENYEFDEECNNCHRIIPANAGEWR